MTLERRIVFGARLAAFLAVVLGGANARHVGASKDVRHGITARSRVLDRSEELCRAILALDGPVQMKADAFTVTGRDGRPRRYWTMDCFDYRHQIAHMLWNADNGELAYVSAPGQRQRAMTKAMSGSQAERYGRAWIGKLNLSDRSRRWKRASPPEWGPFTWRCSYSSGRRRVSVLMDNQRGELICAECRPM